MLGKPPSKGAPSPSTATLAAQKAKPGRRLVKTPQAGEASPTRRSKPSLLGRSTRGR